MKRFEKSLWVTLALVALLVSCKPENVDPAKAGDPSIAAMEMFDEEHPNLDTVCKFSDSVYFRSNDGSWYVNVCNDGEFFSPQVVPCVGQQPRWGSFVMYNGYEYRYDSLTSSVDSIHFLDVDFTLAPGLFCVFSDWLFTIDGTIYIDPNTNFPMVGTDWSNLVQNPVRNEWKVRVPVAELPSPCFDMACRMHTIQLSLFEGAIAGSDVDIWAVNQFWNVPGHPAQSSNQYSIHYCPFACLETVQQPEVTTNCVNVQVGWPGQLSGCATLDAGATAGATYAWSSGQTTQTISVCPMVNTDYTVTVTVNNEVVRVIRNEVHVTDVRCGNPNQPQHKVWVCHIPPGNPNNPQDICIDWSGVPAHVEKYRAPGSNPRLGHDSGCDIGRCGSNPCL